MRKATSRRSQTPSAAALRQMPEVDFTRATVRRNPFADRIEREGIELLHDGPTRESLAAVREVDYSVAKARRNPYASRVAEALSRMEPGRGRPPRGREVGPTPARSVRLPADVWKALEDEAHAEHTTVHALLRKAVSRYLLGDGGPAGRGARRRGRGG